MGGELKGLSKLTSDVRDELIYELKEKAATLGANAVVGLRWGISQCSHTYKGLFTNDVGIFWGL